MSYIETSKIEVFPSSLRSADVSGKLVSEHNFINILNSIVDKDSYVIGDYQDPMTNDTKLRIVIHGYYFEIVKNDATFNRTKYAAIRVSKGKGTLMSWSDEASTNLDVVNTSTSKSEFCALRIEDDDVFGSSTSNYAVHKLQITDSSGNYVNRIKLTSDSVGVDGSKNLTDALNKKQNNVSVSGYVKKDGDKLSLTADGDKKLDSLTNAGSSAMPVYFKDGKATKLLDSQDNSIGGYGSGNKSFTAVYLDKNNGFTKGQTVFFSQSSPEDSNGSNGDIWFKYQ